MPERVEILLADADVLIDYRDAALGTLALVAEHLGPVRMLTMVHDQVTGLTLKKCASLGLEIVEPDLDELQLATLWQPRVGLVDATCLAVARERAWTLVSNDRALGTLCRAEGVARRRGLGLLVELVQLRVMTRRQALRVAKAMQANNPVHLNARVLAAFERELGPG